MSATEKTQVKYTGDWSSDSKLSSVQNGYWEDPFLSFFNTVNPAPKRTSLICRGYYVRFKVCDFFFRSFLEQSEAPMQVVSLGCGMDTSFFRIFPQYESKISKFVETDFASVVSAKHEIIRCNEILRMMATDKLSIVPSDLRNCLSVDAALKMAEVNYEMPTLFYSECVVNYLEANESEALLKWIVAKFPKCMWLAYEQCNADDAFGNVMLKHFKKNGCPLLSLPNTPTVDAQNAQLESVGFETHHVFNAWDAFQHVIKDAEDPYPKLDVGNHMFDEYEALLVTCLHYSVRVGLNGGNEPVITFFKALAMEISNSQLPSEDFVSDSNNFEVYNLRDNELRTYHSSVTTGSNRGALLIGGTDVTGRRTTNLVEIIMPDSAIEKQLSFSILNSEDRDYERIAASVVYQARSRSFYVLGGRKSPRDPCSEDVLQIGIDEQHVKKKLTFPPKKCPPPRWRHSMAVMDDLMVLFGGKNECGILGDLWTFDILEGQWRLQKTDVPKARHSHVMCASPNPKELFLIGGMSNEASLCEDSVIQMSYSTKTKAWTWQVVEDLRIHGCRIGHRASVVNDSLVIVGGYGPRSCRSLRHFATLIDLKTYAAQCFSLPPPLSQNFLPFGFSLVKIVADGNEKLLVYGGGGNCFSFGTYLNPYAIVLKLNSFNAKCD